MNSVFCNLFRNAGRRLVGARQDTIASVLIVTRDRSTYLDLTLSSLLAQVFDHSAWEVVVIDRQSRDDTSGVVHRYAKLARFRISYHHTRNMGYAEGLNEAVGASCGQVLVFLGDDCLVTPQFLLRHVAEQFNDWQIVLGAQHQSVHTHVLHLSDQTVETSPQLAVTEDNPIPRALRQQVTFDNSSNLSPLFEYFGQLRMKETLAWTLFDTRNACVQRAVVDRLGGFHAGYPAWNLGEGRVAGVEFAYRAHLSGVRFHYAPDAIAIRQHGASMGGDHMEQIQNANRLFALHPELNRRVYQRILLSA